MATPNLSTITSVIPKLLYSAQLGAGDTAIYTVPASKAVKLSTLTLCNINSIAVTVSVSLIPSGGAVDGTHKVVNAYSIAAGDTLTVDELKGAWLGDGDKINVNAGTAASIDPVLTGLEFS